MKKILCTLLMVVSLVGCQSTINQEEVIEERLPIDFDLVLDKTFEECETAYRHGKKVGFKEEYLLEHEVSYNENEDNFNIRIVVSDKALDNLQTPFALVSGETDPKVSSFKQHYEFSLKDQLYELDNREQIVIEIYDESENRLFKSTLN